MSEPMRGIVTPVLTPHNADLSIAEDLYLDHAAWCLSEGVHYLSPFGSTSEALSHTLRERMDLVEKLVTSGTARADQLMPGTGLCNLDETEKLCRHGVELGCAAVMTLPPFFYTDATDEGLYRYFSTLIERIGTNAMRICLYHIPKFTKIGFTPALAARLNEAFPEVVVAYKDSSGDWSNTRAVIEAAPGISVFPGNESHMVDAMRIGGGGTISACCNSNIAGLLKVFDLASAGKFDKADAEMGQVNAHRKAVMDTGMIPSLKALKAHQTGDARWLNLRPPYLNAAPEMAQPLLDTL